MESCNYSITEFRCQMLCLVGGKSWAHSLEHTLRIEYFKDTCLIISSLHTLLGKQTSSAHKSNKKARIGEEI